MKKDNTFGDYTFEEWVPEHTQEIIRDFWGCFGRTFRDWLKSPSEQGVRERCSHGPGPNGFGIPPNGASAFFLLKVRGEDKYERVKGRYLHRWNNMGSLIDDEGKDHTVSSCDMWVRVYQEGEQETVRAKLNDAHDAGLIPYCMDDEEDRENMAKWITKNLL